MTTTLPPHVQVYRDYLQEKLAERSIPDHLWPGLLAYVCERRPVGGFLTACLENDLTRAVLNADPLSGAALRGIVEFLAWHVPGTAWGSPDIVHAWLAETGPVPTPFD